MENISGVLENRDTSVTDKPVKGLSGKPTIKEPKKPTTKDPMSESESSDDSITKSPPGEQDLLNSAGVKLFNKLIEDIEVMYEFARQSGKRFDHANSSLANNISQLLAKKQQD
jgi:hypothetical protein